MSWERHSLGGSWVEDFYYKAIPQQPAVETLNAAYYLLPCHPWERRRLAGRLLPVSISGQNMRFKPYIQLLRQRAAETAAFPGQIICGMSRDGGAPGNEEQHNMDWKKS
jgi:hypothetical protein